MTSNGQLLALGPEERSQAIAALPIDCRRRLARIACLGVRPFISRGLNWMEKGAATFAADQLIHAAELADLATELTVEGQHE